jgi:tRNA-dihydrouridine synthase B
MTNFNIGQLQLNSRLIQGPLAGISCAPFRELFSFYKKPAYAVTEMISAKSIVNNQNLNPRYLYKSNQEGLLCIQLSGNDPEIMYKAVKICLNYNPNLIDLNCGCPEPKVRKKGCGSALMDTPDTLKNVIEAIRAATSMPITVKIRTSGNTKDNNYLNALNVIQKAKADAIIVHGRHHTENYDISANYQQIKNIVENSSIPIIANGDVHDKESMQRCFEETNASGIMISRASIGRPWIYQELLDNKNKPSKTECLAIFKYHIEQLINLENNEQVAVMQARRLIKYYFPSLNSDYLKKCYVRNNLAELLNILQNKI